MKDSTILSSVSLLILKIAVFGLGVGVLLLCLFGLPAIWVAVPDEFRADMHSTLYTILIGAYIAAVPFFVALFQALRLLGLIKKGKAFSKIAVRYIKITARSALGISIVYALLLPLFYKWAQYEDAPGLIVICMILSGTPFIMAVFMTVVERLLKQAVSIKKENDLTV